MMYMRECEYCIQMDLKNIQTCPLNVSRFLSCDMYFFKVTFLYIESLYYRSVTPSQLNL